jgi:hypothetical protein
MVRIYSEDKAQKYDYMQKIDQIEREHFVKFNVYGDAIMDGAGFCDDIIDFAKNEGFKIDEEHMVVSKKRVVSNFIFTKENIIIITSHIIKRKGIKDYV